MGKVEILKGLGLLNQESSYEELITPQRRNKSVGFCTSQWCNKNNSNMGVAKLKATGDRCPNCSHFLLWRSLTFEQYESLTERGNYVHRQKRTNRSKQRRRR